MRAICLLFEQRHVIPCEQGIGKEKATIITANSASSGRLPTDKSFHKLPKEILPSGKHRWTKQFEKSTA